MPLLHERSPGAPRTAGSGPCAVPQKNAAGRSPPPRYQDLGGSEIHRHLQEESPAERIVGRASAGVRALRRERRGRRIRPQARRLLVEQVLDTDADEVPVEPIGPRHVEEVVRQRAVVKALRRRRAGRGTTGVVLQRRPVPDAPPGSTSAHITALIRIICLGRQTSTADSQRRP